MRFQAAAFTLLMSIAALAASVQAQIVPVGPFTGNASESFESIQMPFVELPCAEPFAFGSVASLCDSTGLGIYMGANWQGACSLQPRTGMYLASANNGVAVFIFGQDVSSFGGYFASLGFYTDATVRFFNASGQLLGTKTANIPANCTWVWNGWQATGSQIRSVEVASNNGLNGQLVMMDDLELVTSNGCTPDAKFYCLGLFSTHGCLPEMDVLGTPSIAWPNAFKLQAKNLETMQNTLLFFGLSGPSSQPFFGGTLCVNPPLFRLGLTNSGGTGMPPFCSGAVSYNLGVLLNHPTGGPLISSGTVINAQVWFRDPQAAFTVGITNGLQFAVCP